MIILAFAFMYYVKTKDSDEYPYDPYSHQSDNPYKNLWESFRATFSGFAPGPLGENEHGLDFFFGIFIVIVLLNVVIAVVSEAWEDATMSANNAFWNYRLDLILEKTRGRNQSKILQALFCNFCFQGLDDVYIDIETVGTTTAELKGKLALLYKERGALFCIMTVVKSVGLIFLGFPTFGILWPKFFRQILFTPPKPKDDDTKIQIHHLAMELEKYKSEIVKYRRAVDSSITRQINSSATPPE